MSVPVNKRTENKLQALADTLTMTAYTLQMCENEKIFPKKSRWTLCNRIIDECYKAIVNIKVSNKYDMKDAEMAKKRIMLQHTVLMNFEALWALMTIAFETYSIPNDKKEIWSGLMLTAEDKVKAWRNSDIRRFKDQFGKSYKD